MINPDKVMNAYNDLGHLGKHKLNLGEVICLCKALEVATESNLMFPGEKEFDRPLMSGYEVTKDEIQDRKPLPGFVKKSQQGM